MGKIISINSPNAQYQVSVFFSDQLGWLYIALKYCLTARTFETYSLPRMFVLFPGTKFLPHVGKIEDSDKMGKI